MWPTSVVRIRSTGDQAEQHHGALSNHQDGTGRDGTGRDLQHPGRQRGRGAGNLGVLGGGFWAAFDGGVLDVLIGSCWFVFVYGFCGGKAG